MHMSMDFRIVKSMLVMVTDDETVIWPQMAAIIPANNAL